MISVYWIGLATLLQSGCREGDKTPVSGAIEVEPTYISFGVLEPGLETTATVSVNNIGSAVLNIESLELIGSSAFSIRSEDMEEALSPGSGTEFEVLFQATGSVEEGGVLVRSDDPNAPAVEVELVGGFGSDALLWTPDPLDFGSVASGTWPEATVTMTNTSGDLLDIEALTLDGDGFEAELPALPLTLAAGEELSFAVTFIAEAPGQHVGTITATASAEADLVLDMTGVISDRPVAVCSVDPTLVTNHSQTATWYGDQSYAPDGDAIVDYEWYLEVQPGGSGATMPPGDAIRGPFTWDLAGEYIGRLVVTSASGQESEPCFATLTAAPEDELWIEMYWEQSGDDLDLHLLAPGGTLLSDSDCHYANCTGSGLDWGVPGAAADNPSLDLDDIAGVGPENIRVEAPEDGEFALIVHDFPASVDSSANRVWMNIYVAGAAVHTETCSISGEDSYVEFARVSFPDGSITSSSCAELSAP